MSLPSQSSHAMLGQRIVYTEAAGIEQTGTLVGIVTEPSYIIARPWSDENLVIAQGKVSDMRPMPAATAAGKWLRAGMDGG